MGEGVGPGCWSRGGGGGGERRRLPASRPPFPCPPSRTSSPPGCRRCPQRPPARRRRPRAREEPPEPGELDPHVPPRGSWRDGRRSRPPPHPLPRPPRPSWGGTCSGGAGRSRGAAGDGVLWRPVVSSEPGAAGARQTPGGECAPRGVEDAGAGSWREGGGGGFERGAVRSPLGEGVW